MKKKVVCIGAGTGQSAILSGLKEKDVELFGLVAVTDNGGHSGIIRKSLSLPQVGDSRSCLVSVAKEPLMRELFSYRFSDGELSGVNVGNLLIAALIQKQGSFLKGIEEASKLLKTQAAVLPVSDCDTHIGAELDDGSVYVGEWEIMERKSKSKIKRLFLSQKANANPACLEAIKNADLIVIGPGSLRTGLISNLLVKGIPEALKSSKAKKVYVCNIMTQPGQTDGFSVKDHLNELEKYLGFRVDVVLMNNKLPKKELLERYKEDGSDFLEPMDCNGRVCVVKDLLDGREFEARAVGKGQKVDIHYIRHDPEKVADAVLDILNQHTSKESISALTISRSSSEK